MKIPEIYNYIGIFLTLRCNLNCLYCINKHSTFKRREEISADKWLKFINGLEISKDLPITLEGGEPSLYNGFYDIIKGIVHPVDILTNLQFDVDEFIKNVNPDWLNRSRKKSYKSIRVSYHNQIQDELLNKVTRLQDAGFSIGLFSVNVPEKTVGNMEMAEKSRLNNVYFFIKDFLGYRDNRLFGNFKYIDALSGHKKNVTCKIKELLIAPDGNIFRCHRDLYADENNIGNLLNEKFVIEDKFRDCSNYGDCSPCDVKLKTNRFLEMGNCSVEIK